MPTAPAGLGSRREAQPVASGAPLRLARAGASSWSLHRGLGPVAADAEELGRAAALGAGWRPFAGRFDIRGVGLRRQAAAEVGGIERFTPDGFVHALQLGRPAARQVGAARPRQDAAWRGRWAAVGRRRPRRKPVACPADDHADGQRGESRRTEDISRAPLHRPRRRHRDGAARAPEEDVGGAAPRGRRLRRRRFGVPPARRQLPSPGRGEQRVPQQGREVRAPPPDVARATAHVGDARPRVRHPPRCRAGTARPVDDRHHPRDLQPRHPDPPRRDRRAGRVPRPRFSWAEVHHRA